MTDDDHTMSTDDDSAPNSSDAATSANAMKPADDAARRLLARARSTARATPPRASGSSSRGGPWRSRGDTRSGAGPDGRDPQTAGDVLDSWLTDAGFTEALASGGVEAHWETIVGADVAGHVTCEPTQTPEGRVLILRADSTAWATQVRLLLPMIHRRIHEVLGHAVTDPIRVLGPAPPKRSMGPRRVPGPGPRDTYG